MPLVLAGSDIATPLFIDLPAIWNNAANKIFDALESTKRRAALQVLYTSDYPRTSTMRAGKLDEGAQLLMKILDAPPDGVSGPGLVEIYRGLAALAGDAVSDRTPAEITARALCGEDHYAVQAVDMFFCFLGTVAGDLALTLAARGGIYVAGGILPQIAAS
ncbi:MAG: glucokinase [Methylocella sp.]